MNNASRKWLVMLGVAFALGTQGAYAVGPTNAKQTEVLVKTLSLLEVGSIEQVEARVTAAFAKDAAGQAMALATLRALYDGVNRTQDLEVSKLQAAAIAHGWTLDTLSAMVKEVGNGPMTLKALESTTAATSFVSAGTSSEKQAKALNVPAKRTTTESELAEATAAAVFRRQTSLPKGLAEYQTTLKTCTTQGCQTIAAALGRVYDASAKACSDLPNMANCPVIAKETADAYAQGVLLTHLRNKAVAGQKNVITNGVKFFVNGMMPGHFGYANGESIIRGMHRVTLGAAADPNYFSLPEHKQLAGCMEGCDQTAEGCTAIN